MGGNRKGGRSKHAGKGGHKGGKRGKDNRGAEVEGRASVTAPVVRPEKEERNNPFGPRDFATRYSLRERGVAELMHRMPTRTIPKNIRKLIAHWVDVVPGTIFDIMKAPVRFRTPHQHIDAEPTPPAATHDDAPADNKSCVYLLLFQGTHDADPRGHPFSTAVQVLTKENGNLFGGLCPSDDRSEMISWLCEHVKKQTHGEIDFSSVTTWYTFYELQRKDQVPIFTFFPAYWESVKPPYLSPLDGKFTPLETLLDPNASFIPSLSAECVAEFVQKESITKIRHFLNDNAEVDRQYKEVLEVQNEVLNEKKLARHHEMENVKTQRAEEEAEKTRVWDVENEGLTEEEIRELDETREGVRCEMRKRWKGEDVDRRKRWREDDEADPCLKRRSRTKLVHGEVSSDVKFSFAVFDVRKNSTVPNWLPRAALLNSDDALSFEAASKLTRSLTHPINYKTGLKSLSIVFESEKESEPAFVVKDEPVDMVHVKEEKEESNPMEEDELEQREPEEEVHEEDAEEL